MKFYNKLKKFNLGLIQILQVFIYNILFNLVVKNIFNPKQDNKLIIYNNKIY